MTLKSHSTSKLKLPFLCWHCCHLDAQNIMYRECDFLAQIYCLSFICLRRPGRRRKSPCLNRLASSLCTVTYLLCECWGHKRGYKSSRIFPLTINATSILSVSQASILRIIFYSSFSYMADSLQKVHRKYVLWKELCKDCQNVLYQINFNSIVLQTSWHPLISHALSTNKTCPFKFHCLSRTIPLLISTVPGLSKPPSFLTKMTAIPSLKFPLLPLLLS